MVGTPDQPRQQLQSYDDRVAQTPPPADHTPSTPQTMHVTPDRDDGERDATPPTLRSMLRSPRRQTPVDMELTAIAQRSPGPEEGLAQAQPRMFGAETTAVPYRAVKADKQRYKGLPQIDLTQARELE